MVDLVENAHTKKRYALKRITCHSVEDQKQALQEIDYYKKIRHENIIELIDSAFKGYFSFVTDRDIYLRLFLRFCRYCSEHDIRGVDSFTVL